MNFLKKKSLCLFLTAIIGAANSHAATGLNYLEPVQVRSLSDGVGLVLKFRAQTGSIPELDEHALSYGEGWAQIQIPGSYIDPPKQSLRLEKGPLTEVFAYQFDENVVRVRFYARGSENGLRNLVRLKKETGGLMVMIPTVKPVTAAPPRVETRVPLEAVLAKQEEKPPSNPSEESASPAPPFAHSSDMPVAATPERHPEWWASPKPKAPSSAIVLGAEAPDLLYSSLKMAAALVFVLAIMLGCYYLFKKTLGKKMGFAGKDRLIKVVSSAYIGPKKSIALVEVAGETLVLGISGDQMTLLSKMIQPEEPSREETADIPRPWQNHGTRNFAEALKSAGNGIPAGEDLWARKES